MRQRLSAQPLLAAGLMVDPSCRPLGEDGLPVHFRLFAAGALIPQAILLAATTTGRDLAPRVASMLGTGLAADCTGLYVDSWNRHGVAYDGLLHMVRPAMAGGVLATCLCPEARPQMATVRPGVFEVRAAPRQPRTVHLPVALAPTDLRVELLERRTSAADVDPVSYTHLTLPTSDLV